MRTQRSPGENSPASLSRAVSLPAEFERAGATGVLPFAVALSGVALAAAAAASLGDFFGNPPSLLLILPVLFAGILGGPGVGIAATALATGVAFALALWVGAEHVGPGLEVAAILVTGIAGAWQGQRLQRARETVVRSHRALVAEQAQLASVFETAPDGIMVIDDSGKLMTFNMAAERLFEYSAKEVLGQNVRILMPEPYREEHDGYIAHYLTTGERRIIGIGRVVVGRRKDGTTFPLELSVGEIATAGGRYFTGFVRDLTERQAADLRLQDLQEELTHISRLSAMGEMASALAHELNQPLAAITNYVRGSMRIIDRDGERDCEPDRALLRETLDKVADQALRAGDIIKRLRDFMARGETEKTIERVPKLVEEAIALGMVGAKEQGVRISLDLAPHAELVMVDRIQIQQVLVNLIRNGLEAMRGCNERRMLVASRAIDDNMVEVTVADTGSGLSPEARAQLFVPFFTTKSNGMGVGLSICQTIVESHGGRIWATDNPDAGTTFHFTLRSGAPQENSVVG